MSNPKSTAHTGVSRSSDQGTIAAAVSSKLDDANIKTAITIFCSEDKPVLINWDSLEVLCSKHRRQPFARPITPMGTSLTPFQTSEEKVRMHIRSIAAGSLHGWPDDELKPNTTCWIWVISKKRILNWNSNSSSATSRDSAKFVLLFLVAR